MKVDGNRVIEIQAQRHASKVANLEKEVAFLLVEKENLAKEIERLKEIEGLKE